VPAFEFGITVSIGLCFSGYCYRPHFKLMEGGRFGNAFSIGVVKII